MTTSQSPRSKIKAQAEVMARMLKAAERGELPDIPNNQKIIAALAKPEIKFVIAMDDKLVSITMAWKIIKETSELALTEFIIKQMIQSRDN